MKFAYYDKGDISNVKDKHFKSFKTTGQPFVKKDQDRSIPHNIQKDKFQIV